MADVPGIYEGRCPACSTRHWIPDATSWLLIDEDQLALDEAKRDQVLDPRDLPALPGLTRPKAVPLDHPGEHGQLERLGISREDAIWQGRLLSSETHACRECGECVDRFELRSDYEMGRMAALPVFVLGILFFKYLRTLTDSICGPLTASLILVVLGMTLTSAVIERWRNRRWSARGDALRATNKCPGCGSTRADKLHSGIHVKCLECGQPDLELDLTGVS